MTVDKTFFIQRFAQDAAKEAAAEYRRQFDFMSARCESPIEEVYLGALLLTFVFERAVSEPHFLRSDFTFGETTLAPYDGIFVYLQAEVLSYRVDFLLVSRDGADSPLRYFVVECDGHDFHERTKEQAARDRQRDREMTEQGFTVLRYTGSEIWRDPRACAINTVDIIDATLARSYQE